MARRRRSSLLAAASVCAAVSGVAEGSAPQSRRPDVKLDMYAPVSLNDGRWGPFYHDVGNTNWYDAGGLLSNLLTKVLPEAGQVPGRPARAANIDHILVLHLRVSNPPEATSANHQWEFAPYISFENGAVASSPGGLGAKEALERLQKYGDQVGIKAFRPGTDSGEPLFSWDGIHYSFSISGSCPNLPEGQKGEHRSFDPACLRHASEGATFLTGADCRMSINEADFVSRDLLLPDGTLGCAVVVESVDIVSLDELAGISKQDCGHRHCASWHDFHVNCTDQSLQFSHKGHTFCREFDATPGCASSCDAPGCKAQGDVGLPFWRHRCNASWNTQRAEAIVQAFSGGTSAPPSALGRMPSPSCSTQPDCGEPRAEEGNGYCHRDASGVCDACFVPGTVSPRPRPLGQPRCRMDLFVDEYPQLLPKCSAPCGGRCSTASDEDTCCIYIGACKTDWEVGGWGACSSTCGEGVQTRKVWCPFANAVGGCEESRKPRLAQPCRGQSCPWHQDVQEEDDWGPCENSCGAGIQHKRPRCACPAPCPQGDVECGALAKPRPLSRQCHRMTELIGGNEYCKRCSDSCAQCFDGFQLSKGAGGRCENRHSFVKASFHVGTPGRLLEHNNVTLALPRAFERAINEVAGISAQVVSLASIVDDYLVTGKTLVTFATTSGEGWGDASREEEAPEVAALLLSRTQLILSTVDRIKLGKALTRTLQEELHGAHTPFGQSVIPVWIDAAAAPQGFCSQLRRWLGPDLGCSQSSGQPTELPPAMQTEAPSAPSGSSPGTKAPQPAVEEAVGEGAHGQTSSAEAPAEAPPSSPSRSPRGDDAADQATGSDRQRQGSPSLVARASLGAAAVAATLVAAAVAWRWQWRQGTAANVDDQAQLFKGLAGTSSW